MPGFGVRHRAGKVVVLGALTCGLYLGLFLFEDAILRASGLGRWYFVVPVTIAFIFSWVHGAFTGHFWDALGVQAKK